MDTPIRHLSRDQQLDLQDGVFRRYGADYARSLVLTITLQEAGFGRNPETVAALRAVADLMEESFTIAEQGGSPIPTPFLVPGPGRAQ